MFSIFITQHGLERMAINELPMASSDQSSWFKIIKKQREIHISTDGQEPSWEDENNPLFILSMNYGINFFDGTEYIDKIKLDGETSIQKDSPALLLDITPQQARQIQNDYGVICQSLSDMDGDLLVEPSVSLEPDDEEPGYSWKRLLTYHKDIPANALLLIDRYFFANNVKRAIDCFQELLESLLPLSLKCNFQVTLIIQQDKIENGTTFSQLASMLNKVKRRINRPYNIDIMLIGISDDLFGFEKSHNRRIATNFLIISAEHKMAAFCNNKSLVQQRIEVKTLYSCGLDSSVEDSPCKSHSQILRDWKNIICHWETHDEQYSIAVNGYVNPPNYNWDNRLLRQN